MINKCEKLNITQGTDIQLVVEMRREGKPFPVELSDGVQVNMVSSRGVRKSMSFRVGDGRVAIPLMAEDFAIGVYGVEIFGVLNDAKWRTFGASVVEYTYETVIGETRVITTGDTYDIVLEVGPLTEIIPTFLSQLHNDIHAVCDEDYVHTDNNFEDAYKQFFELGLVTLVEDGVLPEASEDTMNHIYLVPNEASEDVCTAYVTVKKEVVEEEEETPETPDDENPDDENPDEGGETPDEGGDEGGGDEPQPEPEPTYVYEWKQFGGGGGGGTIATITNEEIDTLFD